MNWSNVISKCESECKRTGVSTHVAMNGGKYYVAANVYDEFMSTYIDEMNSGRFLSIVEQHRYIGPAIVDTDLRQSVPTRIYNDVDVRMFVKEFFKKIAKYVVVPENTQCFVLEKEKPRESKGLWKDGVHLVFPDVVTHPCIQHAVRKDMLANWKSFDTDEYLKCPPGDIYDEAVIERNGEDGFPYNHRISLYQSDYLPYTHHAGWLMYGSKKPEEKYAWQVAYTVSKDGKVTEGCELSPGELVERLSIRNKYVETDLTTEGLQKIQEDQEEHVKKEINRQAATEEVYEFADDDESWMMLDSLCALLGEERSKTHKNWMSVGWALNNIQVGESLARRMLWKRFGMLCPTKYDDGEHDRKWSNMGPPRQGPRALGIGSLRMWVKDDNPVDYTKWYSLHKVPSQNSTQRRPAALCTEVDGPLTPTQNHEIKLDAVAKELEEMTSSGINQYVELKNGSITFRNAEGIDGTIDRNRYVVNLGSQCHGAMPKTFTMPVSSLEFLKDVPPDCSFDAQMETSNSEISGVTMTSNNYKGLKVRVLNVNSGKERIRVYTDAGSKFINGKRDIKKTMDIVYEQQEIAMQNRFGINQQIFINNGTVNNNIIVCPKTEGDRRTKQVLVNVLMMAKPDFFERLRYDPTPTKDSTAGDVFNCDPATNKWVVINRIAIQYYLMKKVVPMADLTTEEVDYLFDNNSAVKDIIERLVCEVQSSGFRQTLDRNLDLFVVSNGVCDTTSGSVVFRQIQPDDLVSIDAGWDYDKDLAIEKRHEVDDFFRTILPVEEERDVVLNYIACLLSGRRKEKKILCLTDRRGGYNGKSAVVGFLGAFFGKSVSMIGSKMLSQGSFTQDRNSHDGVLDEFKYIRLMIAEEMSSTTKLDSGFMKKISGGSNVGIAGRKCGKGDMFEYIWQSGVLCVFNENQFPSMDVTDKASIARIMVAPMRSKFVDLSTYTPEAEEEYVFDTDTNLHLKFNDWRSAMMDVMVERYVDDRERLFSSLPESMGNWKADVLGSANPMSEWLSEVLVVTGNSSDFVTGGYLKTEWVSAHGVQGKGSGFTIPLINAYIEGVNKAEKDPSKRVIICGAGSSNVVVENNRITTKRHVYKGIAFKPLHDEIVY